MGEPGKIDYIELPGGRIQPVRWEMDDWGEYGWQPFGSAYTPSSGSTAQAPQWKPGEKELEDADLQLAYDRYELEVKRTDAGIEADKAEREARRAESQRDFESAEKWRERADYWRGVEYQAQQDQLKIDNQLRSRGLDLTEFNLNLQKMGLFGYDDQGKPTLDRDKFNQAIKQWNDQYGLQLSELGGYMPGGQPTLARDELDALTAYRNGQLALQQGNLDEAKRQFDIAEGFTQRLQAAKLQFDIERDPASFLQKGFAIRGEVAPDEQDIIGRLNPFGWGTKAPQVGQEARPWWMNYSNERLMQMPIEELATLPDEILEQMPNEFFLQSPAHQQLMGRLSPGRIGGQGQWAGTGFAGDVAAQYPGRQGAAGGGRAFEPATAPMVGPTITGPPDSGLLPGGNPDRSGWGADVGEPMAPFDIGLLPGNTSWGVDQGPMMGQPGDPRMGQPGGSQVGPTEDDAFALAEDIRRRMGGMR